MILSDGEIKEAIRKREIIIKPLPKSDQYATTALDLHFGDQLFRLKTLEELQREEPPGVELGVVVNVNKIAIKALLQQYTKPLLREKDGSFILPPQRFALGITYEWIELPIKSRIAARVQGRSTLARLGLIIHATAPTVHAGFAGRLALEMYCFGEYPLRLTPKELPICQLVFERVGRIPKGKLKSVFIGQKKIR